MTPEQQNIAIAEVMGWTNIAAPPYQDWQHPTLPSRNTPSGRPAYHSDLNACAEFESTLTGNEWDKYCDHFGGSLRGCASATAPQRCEAFLRVKGLWRDES
jgi:hypothetical protein